MMQDAYIIISKRRVCAYIVSILSPQYNVGLRFLVLSVWHLQIPVWHLVVVR
jgi:hypothetical protein